MEQGRPLAMSDLGAATCAALGMLQDALDRQARGWDRYARQAAEFHLRNARRPGAAAGAGLVAQIDSDFTLAPYAVPAATS